jgi:hypothetical protein
MSRRLHAIALVDDAAEHLRLFESAVGPGAVVPRAGLNAALVTAWARRFGLAFLQEVPADARPGLPLASVPTVVVVVDPRVASLARSYADAVGAPVVLAEDLGSVACAVAAASSARSATLVLLNDVFDEALIEAISRGNAERVRRGGLPLTVGIVTAFDPPKLAWLLVKTLACLDLPTPRDAAVGRFDGVSGAATLRSLDGSITAAETGEPWTDRRTIAQSVVAHGVAFDLSLGEVVLCSHLDPPLPAARTAIAPSCFHDGICFRLARDEGPTLRRRATEVTPLVWGIDSCGAIAFRNNAFGDGSSYTLALLAGSAVAVIGPYLTLTASGLAARAFEALLENGWSTGEIAAALSSVDDNTVGFAPYVVLGSPDLRFVGLPAGAPEADEDGAFLVRADGRDTVALELPDGVTGLRDVVADDGGEAWSAALARRVDAPGRAALVVAFDGPRRFAGSLRLGDAGPARTALAERCDELDRRLGVLAGYGFAAQDASLVESVRASLRETAQTLRAPYAVRATAVGALRWVRAAETMRALEVSVARHFLDVVVERDVSLDRESENGFIPGPLRRGNEHCHCCAAALYVAVDRWVADRNYHRLKATCPNCFGVSMRLVTSPLAPVGIAGAREGDSFRLRVTLRSGVDRPLHALVAAAPRRGPAQDAAGPVPVAVPEGHEVCAEFRFPPATGGVKTYRVLVLCEGASELYTAFDPGGPTSASTSPNAVTVVGLRPGPGQPRPYGLNQTG